MSEELELVKRLLSRVRRRRGQIWHTTAGSGNRRVVVMGCFDTATGTRNGFTAYVDTWDKSTSRWAVLLAEDGATAEEALMNLEDDLRREAGQCNTP